jgi:predicted phosphodiesterase
MKEGAYMEWLRADELRAQKFAIDEIARIIGLPRSIVRKHFDEKPPSMRRRKRGAVGIAGDIHAPFDHPNYITFLKDTFKKNGCETIIFVGDLVDHHALSRFINETCADSSRTEYSNAYINVQRYYNEFPEAIWILGNHDKRPEQLAASVGMDEVYLKSIRELYNPPVGWEIQNDEVFVEGVLYKHGINCLGKDGAMNAALQERMSTVIGHSHSFGGCKYSANNRNIIFGLNVGCGIDIDAYAFAYGKHSKYRPTLGCGIVHNSEHAEFIPMGRDYFRSTKNITQ